MIFKNRAAFALFRASARALPASDRPAFAAVLAALALTIAAALTGCTKKDSTQQAEPLTDTFIDEQTQIALEEIDKELEEKQKAMTATEGVDFDISVMNANMVYAQVFDMMMQPEVYKDKIIRISGDYYQLPDNKGKMTNAVIIRDALACCQQGMEFVWDFGEAVPAQETPITVTGPFKITTDSEGLMRTFIQASSVE
ncbi:MAG: hypothetical protein IJL34_01200 [Treponema sp.]|nr:hypothetical protein [Treponema sp.]